MVREFLQSRPGRLFLRAELFLFGAAAFTVLVPLDATWRFGAVALGAIAAGSTVSSWLLRSPENDGHARVIAAIVLVVASVWPVFLLTVIASTLGPIAGLPLLAVATGVLAVLVTHWAASLRIARARREGAPHPERRTLRDRRASA